MASNGNGYGGIIQQKINEGGTVVPNRVFVGGVPSNTSEQELRAYFEKFGAVRDVKILRDQLGITKGYGFITYEREEDAKKAQQLTPEALEFKGRRLNVGPAVRKQTLAQKLMSFPPGTVLYTNSGVPYVYTPNITMVPSLEGYGFATPQQSLPIVIQQPVYVTPASTPSNMSIQYSLPPTPLPTPPPQVPESASEVNMHMHHSYSAPSFDHAITATAGNNANFPSGYGSQVASAVQMHQQHFVYPQQHQAVGQEVVHYMQMPNQWTASMQQQQGIVAGDFTGMFGQMSLSQGSASTVAMEARRFYPPIAWPPPMPLQHAFSTAMPVLTSYGQQATIVAASISTEPAHIVRTPTKPASPSKSDIETPTGSNAGSPHTPRVLVLTPSPRAVRVTPVRVTAAHLTSSKARRPLLMPRAAKSTPTSPLMNEGAMSALMKIVGRMEKMSPRNQQTVWARSTAMGPVVIDATPGPRPQQTSTPLSKGVDSFTGKQSPPGHGRTMRANTTLPPQMTSGGRYIALQPNVHVPPGSAPITPPHTPLLAM